MSWPRNCSLENVPLSPFDYDSKEDFLRDVRLWLVSCLIENKPPPPIDYDLVNLRIWVQGILLIVIGILGTIGNLISVIILSKRKVRQSSINIMLLGLSINDLIFVISHIFISGIPSLLHYFTAGSYYLTYIEPFTWVILLPISFVAQTGSIYFTICITLERYIAVCHPLKVRSLCHPNRAIVVSIIVTTFAVIYNIPRAFERRLLYNNSTQWYEVKPTSFPRNYSYVLYYGTLSYTILMFIIPFIILFYLNISIYSAMKRNASARSGMTTTATTKESNSITYLVFTIVITFFLCNILYPIITIIGHLKVHFSSYLWPFAKFLFTLNSSVNFIFYLAFGKQFRQEILKLFSFLKIFECNWVGNLRQRNTEATINATEGTILPLSTATLTSNISTNLTRNQPILQQDTV